MSRMVNSGYAGMARRTVTTDTDSSLNVRRKVRVVWTLQTRGRT